MGSLCVVLPSLSPGCFLQYVGVNSRTPAKISSYGASLREGSDKRACFPALSGRAFLYLLHLSC